MRTTLAIDDDVRAAAKHLAEREHKTTGPVTSTLARQGPARANRASRLERNGIPMLPRLKHPQAMTLALVNQLRDEQP